MRYEKHRGTTHIYIEKNETEQEVLRAIVKASFELARPVGLGWLHFNDNQQMTDEMADQFITLPPKYGEEVVKMDYVQGRQCKTYLSKIGEGHFVLTNHIYERDRGLLDPMLNRAKEILANKQSSSPASTSEMYKGESLDLRLKEYGFIRQGSESDWDFRKRVFPELYRIDPDRAMEFLLGCSAAEWDEIDKFLYLAFISKGTPDYESLVKFANGFAADPIERRKRRESILHLR